MILKMPHQQVGEVNLVDEMVDRLLDMLRKSSQNRDSLKKPFLNHAGVKLLIGIPSFHWRYGKKMWSF